LAHREDDVGGTWRINTYPGLACDVKSRSARWEGDTQRWCLTTSTGEQHHFNIVVSAVGLFTQPVLPDLVEEESFAGTVMHSSRWDHSVRLEGARVAGNVQLPQIVGGATPREVWRDGAHAYFGLAVPGFPNFFMLYGPNTNAGSNGVIFMLEAQARYSCGLEVHAAHGQDVRRRAAHRAGGVRHQDRPLDDWHRLDHPVQQLLPRGQRTRGHPVATKRA
jgi:cation diffusion facilitator CzcD-associated flavoprotein CzcO